MTKHFLFFLFSLTSLTLSAQVDNEVPLDNSPFSRFALGDFVNNNFAASSGFGGLSATYNDPYHLNILNPAAASSLKSAAYEIGIYGKNANLKDAKTSSNVWSGHINYLALGFPLKNQINELLDQRQKSKTRWGMHVALMPYTSVGYNIQAIQKLPNIDSVVYAYTGKGGTYKLMWGNSVAFDNFSVGVNLGYFFGTVKNDRIISLYNVTNDYEDDLKYDTRYNGFVWNIGTQYTYDIMKKVGSKMEKSGKKVIFGAYGNSAHNFNTTSAQTIRRLNYSYRTASGGLEVDTLFKERRNGVTGKGKLPAEFGLGVMFEKENKLRVGINYTAGFWSQYQNELQNADVLKNSFTLSTGIEYTPEYNSYNRYTKKIRYRAGVHYGKDPRVIKGEQMTNVGLNIGFGLPLVMPRQQVSFVDITFDFGKTGVSVLSENYGKVTFGFTLNDNSWFYKRRFN
jgi:hypothetical protein